MATIAAIATGDARFNILVNALTYVDTALPGTNLVSTLANASADLTVFAPTDTAFARLAADLGYAGPATNEGSVTAFLVAALPAETIRDVILYHVSAGAKTLAEIAAQPGVQTLNGTTLTGDVPTLVDREPDLADPSLVQTDVSADNGIVHVIDRVLLPFDVPGNDAPTITGLVAASGTTDGNRSDFDILLRAVQAAGLAGTLNNPAADLTVFAPNDGAFLDLAAQLGFEGTGEAAAFAYLVQALTLLSGGGDPVPLLTDILLNHVAGDSLQLSQVAAEGSVTTLLGPTLTVDGASLVDANVGTPNPALVATDIQTANGIVHVIDGVLLPVDLPELASQSDIIIGDAANESIFGGNGADLIDANAGNDTIVGGNGNDLVLAGVGFDSVTGGNGNDTLFGSHGNDTLSGNSGNDVLDGGDNRDLLVGGNGRDLLQGQKANDTLQGGNGNDTLAGGEGIDLLSGGNGNDIFVFAPMGDDDRIADFGRGNDTLDLRAFGFGDFDDVLAVTTARGADILIDLAEGTSVRLAHFALAQFDAGDVLLS